ncbi:hypothetical protein EDEG_00474 [Edhazardia aedis USNM 41457]|uniref:Uncharacterized protein n=1 Tax=Edhazardia aedis (strain USNM 41457) TaxID=1003232 RepID=J9D192_EDHAE|nr:hypothetical protein EDEG_00474 [Edhazardia aedis USNM 41457]|eukprot:EJW01349.1 hypothetical protein EDEG_00474 [Edhazardia aedis USNM 41457]
MLNSFKYITYPDLKYKIFDKMIIIKVAAILSVAIYFLFRVRFFNHMCRKVFYTIIIYHSTRLELGSEDTEEERSKPFRLHNLHIQNLFILFCTNKNYDFLNLKY